MRLLAGLADQAAVIRAGDVTLSAERLIGAAHAVAADIRGATVVAVHARPTAETVVAVVGGLLAGAAVVPIPPDSGPAEIRHYLSDSGAELTITADLARTGDASFPEPAPADPALIMYTSGTTGPPKGAVLSHRAIEAGIDAVAEAWAWTPDDRLVHGLPLFHVHGLILGALGPLRIGSPLRHTGKPLPELYAAARGSLYFGVPTVWSRVTADATSARALRSARLLVSGSSALAVPVFERLHALTGHRPVERYGMTETLITISNRADDTGRPPGQVGVPVRGARTRIVADDGTDVPPDGESLGELWVAGPMLFDGYRNRPPTETDGWFRTGDVAAWAAGGRHRIVGRGSTDLIKSGGYKIGAGEVEDALLAHPRVREAAVVGTPHADLGEQVTAYVVVTAAVTERELIDFVARTLSVHKRPREIRFAAELPRNAMGKVQKRRLGS